ncbi:putative F-box protein At2g02030 [Papaver somniferum]|uniref:putative F-box protein At2g02030 n=1 Tax=Papaver somniferum TaxID=3469 RepID=UPI000E701DEA|nr:putative F-box protein At2g02030 [Papaver somniferum]
MENLDHDVLENILFRLPLGTATSQANLVCKSWKTILYNKRHNEVGILFTCNEYKDGFKHSQVQLCFGEEYDHIDCNKMNYYYSHETLMEMGHCRFAFKSHAFYGILVGSCNGLVCFQKEDLGDKYIREAFAICNPLTGEFISLKANLSRAGDYCPLPLVVSSGFGYCQSTGEYKVVRIYNISEEQLVSYAQVYTIGSNKWRDMETFIDVAFSYESGPGIFANGVLHWLGYDQEADRIIVFDLKDEKFGKLSLPPPEADELEDSEDPCNELRFLGGNLCWVKRAWSWSYMEIWEYKKNNLNTNNARYGMEEHDKIQDYCSGNSWNWVKDFSIDISEHYIQTFAITKSNQVLILGACNLYCYDPETRAISSHRDDRCMRHVLTHAKLCFVERFRGNMRVKRIILAASVSVSKVSLRACDHPYVYPMV